MIHVFYYHMVEKKYDLNLNSESKHWLQLATCTLYYYCAFIVTQN